MTSLIGSYLWFTICLEVEAALRVKTYQVCLSLKTQDS